MTIHIIVDSTSDIPDDLLEALPISVIPVYITLNGKSYLDNIDLTREEFYRALPDSNPNPTTAAPSPHQFIQAFDQAVEKGASAIFSIHISATFSALFKSAEVAAAQYTRVPVIPINSGNLSLAEGLIAIQAAQGAKAGKTVVEVQAIIDSAIRRSHAYAKLDTIDYLLRGGRMSSIQHSVISLLGIKPILKMNNHISKMEIARTRNKAFSRVLQMALEVIPYADLFGITHANVPDQVDTLISRIRETYPDFPDPMVSEVTPALGTHVGPGALCINWIESEAHYEAVPEKTGIRKWLPDL